jgi:FixJ family two-component response regulator
MGVPLPSILMTADPSVANVVKAMRHGAAEFMFKPFTEASLLAKVRSTIASRPAWSAEPSAPCCC